MGLVELHGERRFFASQPMAHGGLRSYGEISPKLAEEVRDEPQASEGGQPPGHQARQDGDPRRSDPIFRSSGVHDRRRAYRTAQRDAQTSHSQPGPPQFAVS